MINGECNCGAVAFEVTDNVSDVFVCHCSICRRFTGTNGIAVVLVGKQNFRWIRGEEYVRVWKKPHHDWQANFCLNCGSALPGVNDDALMFIPAGLILTGGQNLKVAHHIWVDSKAPWDEISGTGKQHLQAFES